MKLISQAQAAHFVPASESPAEAIALSAILAVVATLFLIHTGRRMWQRRRLARNREDPPANR